MSKIWAPEGPFSSGEIPKNTRYLVVESSDNIEVLTRSVNILINAGEWEVLGGISAVSHEGHVQYLQSMSRKAIKA